jgi:S-adenosylmethionine uptake transporter
VVPLEDCSLKAATAHEQKAATAHERHAFWMLAAALAFALMAACVKAAAQSFTPAELVAWRGVVSGLLIAVWARWQGVSLRTPVPLMQAWRSVVGVISLGAWFVALAGLPLPNAMTLNYTSGLWLAAFVVAGAMWRMGDLRAALRLHGALALCVLSGFAGIVVILQPQSAGGAALLPGLIGALSGFFASLAYAQVQALARAGEPELRTVFYFALGCAVAGFALALPTGLSSVWRVEALWLLPIGVLAAMGQMAMTRSFSSGATLLVVNMQYSGIVFSVLLGWLVFGESLNALGWLGVAIVIGAGISAAWIRSRQSNLAHPAPEASP